MKDPKKVIRGKKSKAAGAAFELFVRKNLESKGWIVDKFTNNVDLENSKLIPAKHKFRGIGIPMSLGTGFCDFLAFRLIKCLATSMGSLSYEVIGVEAKTNGYLDKIESKKCKWLLENNIFSKIFIAEKTKIKNKVVIIYHDFVEKYEI